VNVRRENPWQSWIDNGPELGYSAKLDSFSFALSVEPGLQIKGVHDQTCDGFFPFSELEACGFSPTNIATAESLVGVKRRRQTR
jgi:hypothetical protein